MLVPHPQKEETMNHYDQPLAPWERELRNLHNTRGTIAVFFKDGESVVFDNIDREGIEFDYDSGLLSFVDGRKDYNIPGVRYWTEQPNW
jgi:hypothetical protein